MEIFKNNIFVNLNVGEIINSEMLETIWKRGAPENDDDPSKQILEILNMGPISSRKHDMEI